MTEFAIGLSALAGAWLIWFIIKFTITWAGRKVGYRGPQDLF